jgi:xanthine dehydrogenase YagS FAD-binding subunit
VTLFTYAKPGSVKDALGREGRFLAGGTTLFDLMKLDVERPEALVDVNGLPLEGIERTPDGGLRIGAMARNATVAHHPEVLKTYPALSQAILQGASAQIRNMASTAGNLLQRTRCVYFRDVDMPCNKREPGSGCSAIDGHHRNLAILGVSDHCIASNPSDQNVALMALDATVHIQGAKGSRAVPVGGFYLLPDATPHKETVLQKGELVTHLTLPPLPAGTRSLYLKLRDRASYEFALASTAAVVRMADGRMDDVRLAMGGVGAIPWRAKEAEAILRGQTPSPELFARAAEATFRDARPRPENAFTVALGRRCLVQALTLATRTAPPQVNA